MKLLLAFLIERLHRYVFDNIYFSYQGRRERRLPPDFTREEKVIISIHKMSVKILPKYRTILRQSKLNKGQYNRYNLPE